MEVYSLLGTLRRNQVKIAVLLAGESVYGSMLSQRVEL